MTETAKPHGSLEQSSSTLRTARRKAPLPKNAQRTLRVLCVDDHAVLVEGLKAQFSMEQDIECAGSLSSAARLLEDVARLEPDVVLLDIEMPGPDVFEMADRLRHMYPQVRFIFLSAHVRDGYLAAAYKCGGSGYFSKGDELEEIVSAVKQVASCADGAFAMGPKVQQHCSPASGGGAAGAKRRQKGAQPPTAIQTLTPREFEILRLIGKGLSRSEISRELSRSPKTIDNHQVKIMAKLGLHSRTELLRFAIREGLAEP